MKKMYSKFLFLFCLTGLFAFSNAFSQTYFSVNLTQPPALTALAGVDDMICPGDSSQLGGSPSPATGGYGSYVYSWSPTTGLSSASIGNPKASPVISTTYIMTVTDAKNCTNADSVTVTVDTCTGINSAIVGFDVSLVPNPTSGAFSVQITNNPSKTPLMISIHDLFGRTIKQESYSSQPKNPTYQYDLSEEAAGVYLVTIQSETYRKVFRLVVK